MELKNSHGGYAGLSISEKIQHRLDDVIAEQRQHLGEKCSPDDCPATNRRRGEINSLAWVLALMRNTTLESERHDAQMREVASAEGIITDESAAPIDRQSAFRPYRPSECVGSMGR